MDSFYIQTIIKAFNIQIMMKAKRIIHAWLWMLLMGLPLALALGSCESNVHENEQGGLSISLAWQDADDATTVKNIRVWIFNAADGSLVKSQEYTDARVLANERYPLSNGQYKVVAAVNLTAPLSASNTSNINDLLFSLSESSASPERAFYGVTDATVSNSSAVTSVTVPVQRLLAELTITIDGAPASSVLTGEVQDVATSFNPCKAQTNTDATTVTLPTTTAQGETLQMQTIRLMPIVSNQANSHLYLSISRTDGVVEEYDITVPVMMAGGKYEIRFQHSEMHPKMNLESGSIQNWNEQGDSNEHIAK